MRIDINGKFGKFRGDSDVFYPSAMDNFISSKLSDGKAGERPM
jgi:hypothetical protein